MDEALGVQIEDMAGLQFTDAEIARIVGLSPDALNEYRDNIDRGRLLAEAEVRRAINKAAKLGDAAAIKQFLILNDRTKSFVL
jgi:predicted DNA-binding protein (UPF0278 family)